MVTSQLIPHLISWTSLPQLPVTQSTAATLYGQRVISSGKCACHNVHSLLYKQIHSLPQQSVQHQ